MAKVELNKKTSELLITVNADKKTWKEEQDKAFKKLAANLSLKGFRKGQVPLEMAKKTIGQSEIFTTAIQKTLDLLVKDAAKEIDDEVIILDSPTYKVEKISAEELEVTFVYPIYPDVKIGNYKNIAAKYEEAKLDEKVVTEELNKITESKSELKDKKGALAKGDTAFFDFEGFVEGKPFDGGKAANYELIIGSGAFIAGFEDQMVGLNIGESKDINVVFPEEYHVEMLKAKPALFKIKLNSIKTKSVPKLDDAMVISLNIPKVKTVAELEKYLREVFTQQNEQDARIAFQRASFDEIRKQVEVNIPASLVVKEMHHQQDLFVDRLKKQGLDVKRYFEMTGQTPEQLNSQFKSTSETKLIDSIIFAEIAKAEKIEITESDYEAAYIKYSGIYGQSVEGVKGAISKAQLQVPLTNDKVLDVLIKASSKATAK